VRVEDFTQARDEWLAGVRSDEELYQQMANLLFRTWFLDVARRAMEAAE